MKTSCWPLLSMALSGHLLLTLAAAAPPAIARQTAEPVAWPDIQPSVAARCVMCHTGEVAPLGLRLDSLEGLMAGSDNGPVVVSGDADASELIRRIRGEASPRMPMTGPPFLSDDEIALFEAWVSGGLQTEADAPATTQGETRVPDTVSEPAPAPDPEGETVPEPQPESMAEPQPAGPATWQDVAPILATRCAKCHTDQGLMGPAPEGYRLTSYESTLSPADRARVIPGNPEASELVRRIRGQSLPRMPFDGPPFLGAGEIALITDWIAAGAPDATGRTAGVPTGAKVRLQGILEDYWVLDGLRLVVPPGTRIDKNPNPGDYVEVRGVVDHQGDLRAERIRRR